MLPARRRGTLDPIVALPTRTSSNAMSNTLSKEVVERACTEIETRLAAGERHVAEDVLHRLRDQLPDEEAILKLIYTEFVALEGRGAPVTKEELLARFPEHRTRLDRLLAIHEILDLDLHRTDGVDAATSETDIEQPGPAGKSLPFAHIGQYEILEEIGRGGMGVVYRARQNGLGRIVAVKLIRLLDPSPELRKRFLNEARMTARLQHPCIVQVVEIGVHQGTDFLVMEYVHGEPLEKKVAEGTVWSPDEAARLLQQVSCAVATAHDGHIVHRDLKPANILLTSEGVPKVVDFGLAMALETDAVRQTQSGALLGTPIYMAPEQALGRHDEIGYTTDVHALGVILFELLTGQPPFSGKTPVETLQQIRECDATPPHVQNAGVPRDLSAVCLKALQKSPRDRYPSARELVDDLNRFLAGVPVQAVLPGVLQNIGRQLRRCRTAVLNATVLLTSVIVSALVLSSLSSQNSSTPETSVENLRLQAAQREAEKVFERARDAVGLWARLGDAAAGRPQMDAQNEVVFARSLEHYDRLLKLQSDDPQLRFDAAVAWRNSGMLQMDLGNRDIAEKSIRQACRNFQDLIHEGLLVEESQLEFARSLLPLAWLQRIADRPIEAEATYQQVVDFASQLGPAQRESTAIRLLVANALGNFSAVLKGRGEVSRAIELNQRSIQIQKDVLVDEYGPALFSQMTTHSHESPLKTVFDTVENPSHLAALTSELAMAIDECGQLARLKNRWDEAHEHYSHAVALGRAAQLLDPGRLGVRISLSRSYDHLGALHAARKNPDLASQFWRESVSLLRRLVADYPDRSHHQSSLARVSERLGLLLLAEQKYEEAADMLRITAGQKGRMLLGDPNSQENIQSAAKTLTTCAQALTGCGRIDDAMRFYERAVSIDPGAYRPRNRLAWMLAMHPDQTRRDVKRSLSLAREATRLNETRAACWNTLAAALIRHEQWQQAIQALDKSVSLKSQAHVYDNCLFALACPHAGRPDQAREAFASAAASMQNDSMLASLDEFNRALLVSLFDEVMAGHGAATPVSKQSKSVPNSM